jgi:hypothetical protein
MADESKKPQTGISETPMSGGIPGTPPQPQFSTDAANISTVYTNFCHVSITPEELILDFGLNTQMAPNPTEPIKLSHRVVMNFYTAKRLMNALHFAVSRHENTFGLLELDFQKRARGGQPGILRPGAGAGGGFQP